MQVMGVTKLMMCVMLVDDFSNTVPLCSCPMSVCLSVCFFMYLCVCLHFSTSVALMCLRHHSRARCTSVSVLPSLDPCLPHFFFFGFIPVSLLDGRSSSQALKEEDVPALNPPQLRKGRFQVGETTDTLPHRGLSQVADDIPRVLCH